ncbi:Sua5/YciO/YrdC/YwlC family protein [Spirochaeta thermophila DSM 6578]|uniref:Threonylcarbamoyl-AMP synthase n=1 Tax=Winmispira thermophila (strain ATCC 700085 / DSM 6578 / Z-1203) TaxID=869211 RepID=G0GF52_WINT7|nr:L-threonylcarbamoyladenylate synthase [Spirochaeta thermophila]AEJ60751.1 Sua5/YciO/YrdC/YwlC family protein [Spirochaeta thermophila DSM 6578]
MKETRVVPATDETIEEAARLLREGEAVAFPTETVYGLGANALDAVAVARIFEIKERPLFDPLIVHISGEEMVGEVVREVPDLARTLMARFWPGPLTLVLPKGERVPGIVTAGLPTVGVRMPAHPVARRLIEKAEVPIAAPSANRFGSLSPTRAGHVAGQLGGRVALVLDGGACEVGVESTVVRVEGGQVRVLRPGGVPVEALEEAVGRGAVVVGGPEREGAQEAPGMLPWHYAPSVPVVVLEGGAMPGAEEAREAGLLAFRGAPEEPAFRAVEVLSPRGDLQEAAAGLFEGLHRLEEAGVARIYAEAVPEVGLGRAVMDRLRKAAKRRPS